MIPQKVKDHIEEYISQEVYVLSVRIVLHEVHLAANSTGDA